MVILELIAAVGDNSHNYLDVGLRYYYREIIFERQYQFTPHWNNIIASSFHDEDSAIATFSARSVTVNIYYTNIKGMIIYSFLIA